MSDDSKRLGYGGSGVIDGVQVLLSGGGFDEGVSPSFINAYDIAQVVDPRSRMLHADGVVAYSGSLAFDVTAATLDFLSIAKLLKRYYQFDVGINDGVDSYVMQGCHVASLSMQGAPGGLIASQVAVVAKAKEVAGPVLNNNIIDGVTHQPYGYWYSGNTDVRDWNFTMTQDVQPVYSNESSGSLPQGPRYLKVGLVTYSLQVTTYDAVQAHTAISVATSSFTLQGVTAGEAYTFNGLTDLGMYSHTFETSASATVGSDDSNIIT